MMISIQPKKITFQKCQIGQCVKEAKGSKFKPGDPFSTNIHIEGDVVQSIIGSSSSTFNITNNRKRRASQVKEKQQPKEEKEEKPKENIERTTDDVDIFYHVNSEQDIWDLWSQFFKECKADEKMHEFSLEKVDIIQYGYKVKMCTCLVRELYEHMVIPKPILHNAFNGFEEDLMKVFLSEGFVFCQMKISVNAQKQQWIRQSEANYSGYLIWELFKIVTNYSNNKTLCFEVGEYKVQAIKNEIIRRDDKELKLCKLSILEVTGHFGLSDIARSTQDHVKGGFGILAVLQEIAHVFEFGSLDTFHKIRIYFVHALEEKLRLWSLEQVSRGVCVMELIETADIPTNFEDNEICIRDVTNLFCTYKNGLEESLTHIEQLQREHKQVKLSISRKIVIPASTISLIDSLEKGYVLKIKGEYIPGYPELQVSTS
ncbi:unnamed protein product [Rhizopus stolonifer]